MRHLHLTSANFDADLLHRANIKPEAFLTEALIDIPKVAVNTLGIYPTGDVRIPTPSPRKNTNPSALPSMPSSLL